MLLFMMQPPPPPYGPPPYGPPLPPQSVSGWEAERVDVVTGTDFGLVQLRVVPITSGLAIGGLAAGIGSILVAILVVCFGFSGAGSWVAGAFTLLSVLAGGGAVAASLIAMRQIRRSGGPGRVRFTGRGLAIAGISCGGAGAGISLLALLLGLVLQAS
ncbi:hypothetical protein GCM10010168_10940 [Actinoplanes ianthinogenes]|uniref:DUF4190 domain-containing protein n=1 Tax=Actinoplanes ianthinogenes TaxID=122358 RepID=A0ABM7LY97_9ACTN|nr:hypothetical protein Aiant_49380 [Actinoplanes ianthinogenes]GGQ97014.1 hypothetical protein GCM10010168_10940 [Actinoplanes ianthinogenes]